MGGIVRARRRLAGARSRARGLRPRGPASEGNTRTPSLAHRLRTLSAREENEEAKYSDAEDVRGCASIVLSGVGYAR